MAKNKEVKEKPLDKMTVKDLREIAKGIEGIIGVHGMNKAELLVEVKAARGIKDDTKVKSGDSTKEIKAKIKILKVKRQDALTAKDKAIASRTRRQISRLKKRTRRAA